MIIRLGRAHIGGGSSKAKQRFVPHLSEPSPKLVHVNLIAPELSARMSCRWVQTKTWTRFGKTSTGGERGPRTLRNTNVAGHARHPWNLPLQTQKRTGLGPHLAITSTSGAQHNHLI